MAPYVDGFVIPIKKKKLGAYKKMATLGRDTWLKYGALDYYECVGKDLKNPWGLSFTQMCKLKADETVVFAFIVYKSKAQRQSVNKKVHAAFAKMEGLTDMPFDSKRVAFGGFATLVFGTRKTKTKKKKSR